MIVSFIGSRGIPAKYGGFETFVEEVSVGLKNKGIQVIVICDNDQRIKTDRISSYKGVELLYSRYNKADAPILFYLHSLIIAIKCSDIIYSCGVGAGFFAYLPKIFKKKFVINPDGVGWYRNKWSLHVKMILKSMFYCTAKWCDYIVCDSKGISRLFENIFKRCENVKVIEYGAYKNNYINDSSTSIENVLDKYDLKSEHYHLVVSRLEPENNVDLIIKGYSVSEKKYPLIIIGNISQTKYVKELKKYESKKVRFIGGIYDKDELSIIRAKSFSYLHGHSVGGTNPSLLEAMASRNYCICHDNIYNREVVCDGGSYFNDQDQVSKAIDDIESSKNYNVYNEKKEKVFKKAMQYYAWERIVDEYEKYFRSLK